MAHDVTIPEDSIEVVSILQKKVRTTQRYWEHIVRHKHGELAGHLQETLRALEDPDEVYQQDETDDIHLQYKHQGDYSLCAIVRHLNGDGFIVTAYLTTKAKRKGILIWQKKTP